MFCGQALTQTLKHVSDNLGLSRADHFLLKIVPNMKRISHYLSLDLFNVVIYFNDFVLLQIIILTLQLGPGVKQG